MELNDGKIKQCIRKYLQEGDKREQAIEDFRHEVENYIYLFPRLSYRKNQDFCADFYLYVLDRLDGIIRNYPLDADIRFKTWFNLVLRNQFVTFARYRAKNHRTELTLDDMEIEVHMEFFEQDEAGFDDLRQGLSQLEGPDSALIKLYYLPESLDPGELATAAEYFGVPYCEVLAVREKLIEGHNRETQRLKSLAEKLGALDIELSSMKRRLYDSGGKEGALFDKIARKENAKSRLVRELSAPGRFFLDEIAKLFQSAEKAKRRLDIARKKLKFELLKSLRKAQGV